MIVALVSFQCSQRSCWNSKFEYIWSYKLLFYLAIYLIIWEAIKFWNYAIGGNRFKFVGIDWNMKGWMDSNLWAQVDQMCKDCNLWFESVGTHSQIKDNNGICGNNVPVTRDLNLSLHILYVNLFDFFVTDYNLCVQIQNVIMWPQIADYNHLPQIRICDHRFQYAPTDSNPYPNIPACSHLRWHIFESVAANFLRFSHSNLFSQD